MGYTKELEFIVNQIKSAYNKFGRAEFTISQKASFDLVTDIDKAIEKEISNAIKKEFPTDIILGEEFSEGVIPSGRTWTIDPIDGTVNFAHASKFYGVQCSLIDNGEVVLGVIYLPHFEEWFTAEIGKGSFCNGKKISVQKAPKEQAIFSFGDFSRKLPHLADKQYCAVGKLYKNIMRVRMFGGSCLDFSSIACGRIHGTVIITRNLWDLLPGIIIVKEAGGVVKNIYGKDYCLGDDGVIATSNIELNDLLVSAIND